MDLFAVDPLSVISLTNADLDILILHAKQFANLDASLEFAVSAETAMYDSLRSKGMVYATEHLDITISLSSHTTEFGSEAYYAIVSITASESSPLSMDTSAAEPHIRAAAGFLCAHYHPKSRNELRVSTKNRTWGLRLSPFSDLETLIPRRAGDAGFELLVVQIRIPYRFAGKFGFLDAYAGFLRPSFGICVSANLSRRPGEGRARYGGTCIFHFNIKSSKLGRVPYFIPTLPYIDMLYQNCEDCPLPKRNKPPHRGSIPNQIKIKSGAVKIIGYDLCQCGAVKHGGIFYKHADGCNESRVITWQPRDGGAPSRAGTPWQ